MDRISNLPDEIIFHVGSFLSAKEVAFTTVLSKRWHILSSIIHDHLHFDGSKEDIKDFMDGVSLYFSLSLSCLHCSLFLVDKMKTKSFRVRSRRKSVDPYPPLPERFGSRETVPDTSRDVPQKKRRCGVGTGSSESLKFDECIVCEVSDERVTRCSGIHCPIRFHGECLTPEFGGSEDLSNPFCPYCWFKFVSLKSQSLREEVIAAEKAVSKYLDKDFVHDQGLQGEHAECSSKEDNNSHQPEDEGTGTEEEEFEASSEVEERVAAADNVHDAEGDDESGEVQTEVNHGRRRRVEMNATDSEISTTMELDGEDVSERGAATNVSAQPNTLRNVSFFNKDHRRRVFWTPEEEQMLKLGVEKFNAVARKNMPWRKILEMGKDVFHQTRSSTDLKDKWKNITKPQH